MPVVSVIVPAHNAASTLPRTLAALAAQEAAVEHEVIVVDDGSSDATAELAERAPGRVAVLRQRCQGPSAARNRGADAASGDLLAFVDADCFPTPRWLRAGVEAAAGADLVQGAVRADPQAEIGPFDRTLWVLYETGLYESANLFVSRELFERLGGFADLVDLPRGQHFGEDLLFGWRARRAGSRTAFCDEALVHHAVFPRGPAGYVRERLRLGLFADAAAQVPELREHFFFKHLFLLPKTAAFDAAVAGCAAAAVCRSPLPLAAVLPYGRMLARHARGWGHHARRAAAVEVLADAVGLFSLLSGSARRRALVL